MKVSPRYHGPSIITIEGSEDLPGVAVARQRRRLETLLADLSEDEWRHESRCDGWTVQDVVAHLVGVNAFWQASVAAGLAGTPTQVLAAFDPAAHPPLMIEPMRALPPRDVFEQFAKSNEGFLHALPDDAQGWSALAESPAGHVSIDLLAHHALWDSWIHERDIAIPLGRKLVNEADELGISLRYAAAIGPALTISSGDATRGPLAVHATDPDIRFTLDVRDSVAIDCDVIAPDAPCLRGDAADLIEALSIRAPLPDGTPAEWHQLVRGLATVFDTELEPTS
jgi:uncharacterized protein (TIGR03083 family)